MRNIYQVDSEIVNSQGQPTHKVKQVLWSTSIRQAQDSSKNRARHWVKDNLVGKAKVKVVAAVVLVQEESSNFIVESMDEG